MNSISDDFNLIHLGFYVTLVDEISRFFFPGNYLDDFPGKYSDDFVSSRKHSGCIFWTDSRRVFVHTRLDSNDYFIFLRAVRAICNITG